MLFLPVTWVIIGQLLTLPLDSLFLQSMVLKCSSCKALVISLVLVLNSSINSVEFLEIKFKLGSDEVPGILLQELGVRSLARLLYIF